MIYFNMKNCLVGSLGIALLGFGAIPLVQAAANTDASFGTNGIVLTPSSVYGGSDVSIQQSDGKIVTMNAGQLGRYNTNGTKDTSFVTPVSSSGRFLAIQTDGKIVTTGSVLSRYNSDGSLDNTFGIGGQVSVADTAHLAFQSDGKIIVTQFTYTSTDWRGYPNYTNQLMRYNTNGTLDNTFGANGVVSYYETTNAGLIRVAVQADNKIVIGSAGEGGASDNGVKVTRYDANGVLDTSFGNNGVAVVSYSPPITYQNYQCLFYNGGLGLAKILVQGDGKIVVVGNSAQCNNKNVSHNEFSLARFNSNGTLDSTFGSGGKVVTANSNATGRALYDAALQANGKIVAVGYIYDPKRAADDFSIARYNANGSADSTLTGTTKIGSSSDALGVAIQADGKAVASGYATSTTGTQNAALVRYLP